MPRSPWQRSRQPQSSRRQSPPDVNVGRASEHSSARDRIDGLPLNSSAATKGRQPSPLATRVYTISYLILFAILGTLARLGLQAITFYPGAPVTFSVLWANFGGSFFMGFLIEDRMLFKEGWGPAAEAHDHHDATRISMDFNDSNPVEAIDESTARTEHLSMKKTIPLYIGLATGFCGSFTSFSSFMRDCFLALSNDLQMFSSTPGGGNITTGAPTTPRNGGYSFMAFLAVVLITVSLSISALHLGAHAAMYLHPVLPTFRARFIRRWLDPLAAFIAWSSWLGAIFLAVFPPDRYVRSPEIWRGRAVLAITLAPLGCLLRFYAALHLNGKLLSFPIGTFAVNIAGTMILGMSLDLQHLPIGGILGCQFLQGIEDGFCGCLTTVSTWVSEISALRTGQAYRYGSISVIAGACSLIIIMGSLKWTLGFNPILCLH